MTRRRSRVRSKTTRTVTAAVAVVAAGLVVGVALSQGWWPPRAPQPRAPVGAPVPAASVAVDDAAIDAGVRAVLDRSATVVNVTARSRTAQRRGEIYRWTARTVEIKAHARVGDLTRQLERQIAPAGGRILLQTPAVIRIGVRRAGLDLVTHEIQLIPFEPVARVAIIFDDAGGNLGQLDPILALGRPVTVAVLPGLRFSRDVALRAQDAGLEVLLHLPVEPEDRSNRLGPGGVTTAMADDEIARVVAGDLDTVPGAIGINNHEGSRGTADERVMTAVLQVARSRGLFFVDSVTSPRSIGARLASQMQIPTAARAVFLDNQDDPQAIRAQIRRLIALALERKEAVAIGHATRSTPQVLTEMLAEFDRRGIALVPISALVR